MSDSIRVYVNGRGVDLPGNAAAVDAVRAFDSTVADQVMAGDRALTDSRGLPLDPSAEMFAGAIIRIVSGRRRSERLDDLGGGGGPHT